MFGLNVLHWAANIQKLSVCKIILRKNYKNNHQYTDKILPCSLLILNSKHSKNYNIINLYELFKVFF